MKRILSAVTLCLLVGLPELAQGKANLAFLHSKKKCTILHQSEGNISFTVDEGLTAPTGHLGMMDQEYIHTHTIQEWKKKTLPDLSKVPAIFLIGK